MTAVPGTSRDMAYPILQMAKTIVSMVITLEDLGLEKWGGYMLITTKCITRGGGEGWGRPIGGLTPTTFPGSAS